MTPTQDEGKLIAALHECHQGGEIDLITAISVAQVSILLSEVSELILEFSWR